VRQSDSRRVRLYRRSRAAWFATPRPTDDECHADHSDYGRYVMARECPVHALLQRRTTWRICRHQRLWSRTVSNREYRDRR